jgi:hypothetical protein
MRAAAADRAKASSFAGSHRLVVLALRVIGAGLVGTMGGIHAYLWTQGYSDIPRIGPLFLLSAVLSFLSAIGIFFAPARHLTLAAVLGSLLAFGTLMALVVSITVGLFGFQDALSAPLATATAWVEGAAVVVLGALALSGRYGRARRRLACAGPVSPPPRPHAKAPG